MTAAAMPAHPSATWMPVADPDGRARPVPGVPHLMYVDVVGRHSSEEQLTQLQQVHQRHFPDYPHITAELAAERITGVAGPGVVAHQWLLLRDGRPVGCCIFGANVRRGVVLMHYVAVDAPARADLPAGWLRAFTAALCESAVADFQAAGSEALVVMCEATPYMVHKWQRIGFATFPDIGYAEPEHGRTWREHGPRPTWLSLLPNIRPLPAGEHIPTADLLESGVLAFLVDHYRVPRADPRVLEVLSNIARLRATDSAHH